MYSLLYTEAAPRNEQPFHASVNDSSFGQSPAQENRGDVFRDKPSSETAMSDLFKGVQEPSWINPCAHQCSVQFAHCSVQRG